VNDNQPHNPFIRSSDLAVDEVAPLRAEDPPEQLHLVPEAARAVPAEPVLPNKPKPIHDAFLEKFRDSRKRGRGHLTREFFGGIGDAITPLGGLDPNAMIRAAPSAHDMTRMLIGSSLSALGKKPLASFQHSYAHTRRQVENRKSSTTGKDLRDAARKEAIKKQVEEFADRTLDKLRQSVGRHQPDVKKPSDQPNKAHQQQVPFSRQKNEGPSR